MKKKIITVIIFAIVLSFIGIIIWNKVNYISTDEIFQEKKEQFYENQESFEKVIAYVSEFDFRSITVNNDMRTDVVVDGITFRLTEWESDYTLSTYETKALLSQLMNNDENAMILNIIGENSSMSIKYDKKSYNLLAVLFSIKDTRLEDAWGSLIWYNSNYEPRGDWFYPLNDNWTIAAMGVGY